MAEKPIEAYLRTHDVQYVAEDAVFIDMNRGEKTQGREAIGQMLHYVYHVAFDARAEVINKIITDDHAVLEGNFIGTHIGEFAGYDPTGKQVNVPLCVSYDLGTDGLIKVARIYMAAGAMIAQLEG